MKVISNQFHSSYPVARQELPEAACRYLASTAVVVRAKQARGHVATMRRALVGTYS